MGFVNVIDLFYRKLGQIVAFGHWPVGEHLFAGAHGHFLALFVLRPDVGRPLLVCHSLHFIGLFLANSSKHLFAVFLLGH